MPQPFARYLFVVATLIAVLPAANLLADGDPLASWNDGASKRAIVAFVKKVTTEGSADYLPVPQRIAVFDHDGTLWSEQPMYVQVMFTLDRVKELAGQHPEWRHTQPFQGALEGDFAAIALSGQKGVIEIVTATHCGMTTDEFNLIVTAWLQKARHPQFQRPYTECVFQPMLELLRYLRAEGFQTYVVSGGETEFLRAFAEKTYGISPSHVIGSTFKTRYEINNGVPVIRRLPELNFFCDGQGKPVEIQRVIGTRPVFAIGNSDGDVEMLEYTTSGGGPRFGAIIHHTDADREAAYDRSSIVGRLDRALNQAPRHGWTVVSIKTDWKQVFPTPAK